jgi:hypothetical protein
VSYTISHIIASRVLYHITHYCFSCPIAYHTLFLLTHDRIADIAPRPLSRMSQYVAPLSRVCRSLSRVCRSRLCVYSSRMRLYGSIDRRMRGLLEQLEGIVPIVPIVPKMPIIPLLFHPCASNCRRGLGGRLSCAATRCLSSPVRTCTHAHTHTHTHTHIKCRDDGSCQGIFDTHT